MEIAFITEMSDLKIHWKLDTVHPGQRAGLVHAAQQGVVTRGGGVKISFHSGFGFNNPFSA